MSATGNGACLTLGVLTNLAVAIFSEKFPEDFHVIQLDNGYLHQAGDLAIPENVAILFQPAYSPQVNPIERLWKAIKKEMKWKLFDNLDELRDSLKKILGKLTPQDITSLTKWQFIVEGLSVANISLIDITSMQLYISVKEQI